LRIPVNAPFSAFTMIPPSASLVFSVIPASSSAAELASPVWPSSQDNQTGLLGVTSSIQDLSGSSPPQSV